MFFFYYCLLYEYEYHLYRLLNTRFKILNFKTLLEEFNGHEILAHDKQLNEFVC